GGDGHGYRDPSPVSGELWGSVWGNTCSNRGAGGPSCLTSQGRLNSAAFEASLRQGLNLAFGVDGFIVHTSLNVTEENGLRRRLGASSTYNAQECLKEVEEGTLHPEYCDCMSGLHAAWECQTISSFTK
ncbi:unnamed protein product, partial [Discosporangium mesarthrocarpum]